MLIVAVDMAWFIDCWTSWQRGIFCDTRPSFHRRDVNNSDFLESAPKLPLPFNVVGLLTCHWVLLDNYTEGDAINLLGFRVGAESTGAFGKIRDANCQCVDFRTLHPSWISVGHVREGI